MTLRGWNNPRSEVLGNVVLKSALLFDTHHFKRLSVQASSEYVHYREEKELTSKIFRSDLLL